MRFVETPVFTKTIHELMDDDDYRRLQLALLFRPEQGAVIRGGGGLRKIRWGARDTGKRGGVRVIYFWHKADEAIYMLLAYSKHSQEDLTPSQIKTLSRLVREEFK
jgi:hypothetical protein